MSSPTIEQGRAALRDGDAATAQRAFELALAEDGPGEALESLGEALYLQCDYPAAAAYYARAYAAFRRERSHGRRPGGAPQCSACRPSCIRRKSTPRVVFLPVGGADKLALVRAGVGQPGSHQRPATPGTYTPHRDIPGAI